MHILWWIIVGGAAGVLAKAVMPGGGRGEPRGCILTILLGIAGSLIMGFIVHDVLHSHHFGGLIDSIIGATIGALILIWIARMFQKS